jgi:hypothetical protein
VEWVIAPVVAIGVASLWVTDSIRHTGFVRAVLVVSALIASAEFAFVLWVSIGFANP